MSQFNRDLLQWMSTAPTPFHAVENAKVQLLAAGFVELLEPDIWQVQAGKKYFVVRRDSSLVAFVVGTEPAIETGMRILGAHTDSPCLKVKPEPDLKRKGYRQVGVEVYGGALLAPWFDRDLSLAGRVSVLDSSGTLQHVLVDMKRPVAVIPSLAIHLDRNANDKRTINPQEQLPPILWQDEEGEDSDFRTWLAHYLKGLGNDVDEVLDYDLSFYDVQPGAEVGVKNDFLACARLDNLLSCYVNLQSLIHASGKTTSIVVLNDHEEVGSRSTVGAAGNLLTGVIERLFPEGEQRHRIESRSMMMSVDNAHGVHPNFINKHDDNHGPLLNAGPVLKFDANQSYASQSAMSALVRLLAKRADVPLQSFVIRTDMRCGSTIGPITATLTGIETLDIGVPTFGMHSIRELAGAKDPEALAQLLVEFLNHY